jgi:hypothetical protein
MVNNSTNINKTNNNLSPKESLNSDGQQNFHQYHQNKQIVDHHCLNFFFIINLCIKCVVWL